MAGSIEVATTSTVNNSPVPYWRLSGFYFFYFAYLGAWLPYWNLYLEDLGLQAKDIGLLSALVMATKIIAPSLWGWLADVTGKRTQIIRLGSFLAFVTFVAIFIDQSLHWLVLIISLFSFFWNAVLPQFEVVTLSHLAGRYQDYTRIRVWGSIGFIGAVAGLGVIFDYLPISQLPIMLSLILLSIWLSSLFVSEKPSQPFKSDSRGLLKVLRDPVVVAFLFACFLLQVAHGPYYTFFSIYLDSAGYTRTAIGALWSLGVVAEVVLFLAMHKIFSRFEMRSILLVTLLLTTVRWVLIAYYAQYWPVLIFAQCLHAASFGSFHAVAIELIRRFFKGGYEGQGQAIYSSVSFGAGGATGALVSGWIWDSYAMASFLMAAAVSLLAFLICAIWVRGQVVELAVNRQNII